MSNLTFSSVTELISCGHLVQCNAPNENGYITVHSLLSTLTYMKVFFFSFEDDVCRGQFFQWVPESLLFGNVCDYRDGL